MKDSVIKGNGNSRYLKSSLEGITTWEQFRAALAAGTLPVDLNGINPEGFQQLGDPFNKVTLLKDTTAALLGLPNTAVPDDALIAILIGVNKYAFRLTFTFLDGSPVAGKTVDGLTSLDGTPVVTDENGNAFGVSSTPTVEIGMDFTEYIDLENFRTTLTATAKITDVTIKISSISATSKTITTSGQYRFSPNVKDYDVAAIGGGGGGATLSTAEGGGGGGGGSVANLFAQSTKTLTVQIGSAGKSAIDGGSTVISEINLTAEGGKAGSERNGGDSLNGGRAGDGAYYQSGTYHEPRAGETRSVYPFNDKSVLSGGGGGGGASYSSGNRYGASGGSPFGGKGGDGTDSPTAGQNATGFGGGGGGGGSKGYSTRAGGSGYQGAVMFRWRLITV